MEEVKSVLKSKTIWGVLLMIAASVFGLTVPEGVDQEIANIAASVVEAIGAGIAIFGRLKASKKVTLTGK